MNRSLSTQLLAIALCVGLIAAAATRMGTIDKGRVELNKMGSEKAVEQTPPEYAFFIQAFGAFRSLIVNIAFIRAEEYKEQGRYFDAMQLARWICTLQPYFPSVWEFAAWNMSWNISVATFTAEERWNWVYNGVKLLRDEGIQYNPRGVNLYKQLAWTYVNKMSEPTDDYHYAYKCNWAWRMHLVLGPPPQPVEMLDPNALAELAEPEKFNDALADAARKAWEQNEEKRRLAALERRQVYIPRKFEEIAPAGRPADGTARHRLAKQAAIEALKPIAEAPDRLDSLFKQYPDARGMVDGLRGVGIALSDDKLTEDEYWREGGIAFRFFQPLRRLLDPATTLRTVVSAKPIDDPELSQAEALDAVLGVRAQNPAGLALVRWLQKKVLGEVYKMKLADMITVVELFGPVDWRSVDAAGLYWVTVGLKATGESPNDFRNDKLNTARILFFSLRNLFLRNRIIFEPYPPRIHQSYLNLSRDLNFVESMHQAYLRYGPMFDPKEGTPGQQSGDAYRIGHQNFLAEAIRALYLSGREAEADHYYQYLQENYALTETGQINVQHRKTLRDFVLDNYLDTTAGTTGPREAYIAISSLIEFGLNELADGDAGAFAAYSQRAREIYDKFMEDKYLPGSEAKRLPPFLDIQIDTVRLWLSLISPAPSAMDTLRKVRLWRALPLFLRQAVYDDLLPQLTRECEVFDFDVAKAFDEPRNMEQFRAQHPDRRKEEQKKSDVEVETLSPKLGGS